MNKRLEEIHGILNQTELPHPMLVQAMQCEAKSLIVPSRVLKIAWRNAQRASVEAHAGRLSPEKANRSVAFAEKLTLEMKTKWQKISPFVGDI